MASSAGLLSIGPTMDFQPGASPPQAPVDGDGEQG
jgi:hypothetical protein